MIQFITTSQGVFINLGLIVHAEVVAKDKAADAENVLVLTTVLGTELEFEHDDAEALLQRINLLTSQTDAAVNQMLAVVAEAERQAQGSVR